MNMKNDVTTRRNDDNEILNALATRKRNRIIGLTLLIIGFTLLISGIAIALGKGNSTVTIVSIPVIIVAIVISYKFE
jgi:hypothetical protein